jgi:hypothetical protein
MLFWVTSPCALADEDSTAARVKLAKTFEIDDMS